MIFQSSWLRQLHWLVWGLPASLNYGPFMQAAADVGTKGEVLAALAAVGQSEDFVLAQEALLSGDEQLVSVAAKALLNYPADQALPLLEAAVHNGAISPMMAASLFLGWPDQQGLDAALRLLAYSETQQFLAERTMELRERSLPALRRCLADTTLPATARIAAMDQLLAVEEKVGRPSGFGDIEEIHNLRFIKEKYDKLTIDLHEHPQLVAELSKHVSDSDPVVRLACAQLLAWQGFPQGAQALALQAIEAHDGNDMSGNEATKSILWSPALWTGLQRFVYEAQKRELPMPDDLQQLAPVLTDILTAEPKSDLVALAQNRKSEGSQEAKAELDRFLTTQKSALAVGAALRSDAARTVALQWLQREKWPREPKTLQPFGMLLLVLWQLGKVLR